MKVITAAITRADREAFLEMAQRHFRELNPDFVPNVDWKAQYFDTILSRQRFFARWILFDSKRAGFILYGVEDHRFLPRLTGMIYELYVLPEFRRKGIARECALQAIRELRAQGPSKVQLEIMEGNEGAKALWQSLGFEKVSERFVLRDGAL